MARSESKRRSLTCQEFSFGPLRWRSTSLHAAGESDSNIDDTPQTFAERLHALIQQALKDGCPAKELNTILSQHVFGDHDGHA